MSFAIGKLFDPNITKERTFDIDPGMGDLVPLRVIYHPNRITLEGDIGEDPVDEAGKALDADELTQLGVARRFCNLVHDWDATGPLADHKGKVVVESGDKVPLKPEIIRLVPTNLIRQINVAIYTLEQGGNDQNRQQR